MDLTDEEIICMYYVKGNNLYKGKVYISCVVGYELHLRLHNSISGWK